MERQGQDLGQTPLGFGQGGLGAEPLDHIGVLVAAQGVVEGEGQAPALPIHQQPLPVGRIEPHHMQVVAVLPISAITGQGERQLGQQLAIPGGHLATLGDLLRQVGQLAEEHPGLEFVEATVDPELHGLALVVPAVEAAAACRLDRLGAVDHEGAAIPESRQVLGGIEAEGREVPPGAHGPLAVEGAAGLGAVFDQGDAMAIADRQQRFQVAGFAIEVHSDGGTEGPLA
jgi:hypothetical protein